MQHSKIPKRICNKIEQAQRNFIWGDTSEKMRPHLVKWKIYCTPKADGGLGFRHLDKVNEAFFMKLVWGVLFEPSELWVRVLLAKYCRQGDHIEGVKASSGDSNLWKALASVWRKVLENNTYNIGDGQKVRFWTDYWMSKFTSMLNEARLDNQLIDNTLKVGELMNPHGGWDMDRIRGTISDQAVNCLLSYTVPNLFASPDSIAWRGTPTQVFSVKSAYQALTHSDIARPGPWNSIWGWKGPHRIKVFCWLAINDKLLTNKRRSGWGQGISPHCSSYSDMKESIIHVLRD